jgi:hypothetical protein
MSKGERGLFKSEMPTGTSKIRVRSKENFTREEVFVIVRKSKGTERVYQMFDTLSSKMPLEKGKSLVRISKRA